MINEMLKRLDIPSTFVEGKRVSDAATVEVVEMVLSGRINKRIVQAINAQGGKAIGLSGKDANLMVCEKDLMTVDRDGVPVDVDLGYVGRPVEMHPEILASFLGSDFIPVVAPIGTGRNGETFNVNGDTAAGRDRRGDEGRPAAAADRRRRGQGRRRRDPDHAHGRRGARPDRGRGDLRAA